MDDIHQPLQRGRPLSPPPKCRKSGYIQWPARQTQPESVFSHQPGIQLLLCPAASTYWPGA
ncbi:MAG TPA: hypothetical protein VKQ27_15385, partial [Acetobacteraceae bacterium]|nr:hypothetical protein [Acetobacteraceae bacterium]